MKLNFKIENNALSRNYASNMLIDVKNNVLVYNLSDRKIKNKELNALFNLIQIFDNIIIIFSEKHSELGFIDIFPVEENTYNVGYNVCVTNRAASLHYLYTNSRKSFCGSSIHKRYKNNRKKIIEGLKKKFKFAKGGIFAVMSYKIASINSIISVVKNI